MKCASHEPPNENGPPPSTMGATALDEVKDSKAMAKKNQEETQPRKQTRTMAQAFDEWMRRYIDDPAGFSREFEDVAKYTAEKSAGKRVTTYGQNCAAFLDHLMHEPKKRAGRKGGAKKAEVSGG